MYRSIKGGVSVGDKRGTQQVLANEGRECMTLHGFDNFRKTVLNELTRRKEMKDGWNAKEIAEASGLSSQTIYKLANGERGQEPEFGTIFSLAKALGWKMEDVVSELLPEHASIAVKLAMSDPDLFVNILKVYEHGSLRDKEKMKSDIEYAASRL
jgi:transcriptional regulator with XRE-family HTH domain